MSSIPSSTKLRRLWSTIKAPVYGIAAALLVVAIFQGPYLWAQAKQVFEEPQRIDQGVVTDQSQPPVVTAEPQVVYDPARSQDPRIIISSIGVDAPVVFDMTSIAENDVQLAMQSGVLHYGTTALPGQAGNGVYIGHSSGALWRPGNYKWVFTHLEKTKVGDIISVEHRGIKYSYRIYETWVTAPTDLSVLAPTDEPIITLITCTPVGTSTNRFIVRGLQISPAPAAAQTSSQQAQQGPAALPGL